jgi:hypothetical protein
MSMRIRKDRKTILCAAKSEPMEGDFYLDDRMHEVLALELECIYTTKQDENGAEIWEFCGIGQRKFMEKINPTR